MDRLDHPSREILFLSLPDKADDPIPIVKFPSEGIQEVKGLCMLDERLLECIEEGSFFGYTVHQSLCL